MLIGAALVTLYMMIFGGTGDPAQKVFDRLSDRIGEHVKDKTRQKAAETTLEEMRKTREGTFEKVQALSERLSKVHGNHDSPRAEAEKLGELEAVRKEAWSAQVDARFKLRDSMTREEWGKVFLGVGK